jgi:hypothetical protein
MAVNMSSGSKPTGINTCAVLARNAVFTIGDRSLSNGSKGIIDTASGFAFAELDSDNGLRVLDGILNVESRDTPVSIGHGFYRFGRQIAKSGKMDAIFEIPEFVQLNGFGTRMWYRETIAAVSDSVVMHVLTADTTCWLLPDLIIRSYTVDEDGKVTMTEKTAKLYLSSFTEAYLHGGYLILNTCNTCSLVDYNTVTVIDTVDNPSHPIPDIFGKSEQLNFFDTGCISEGRQLGVFFKSNDAHVTELVFRVDIVDGKLAFVQLNVDKRSICKAALKTFGAVNKIHVASTAYQVAKDIVHVNSPHQDTIGRYGPTDEEFLFHMPTKTVLPIVGPKLKKDIELLGMLVSSDGVFVAVLVMVHNSINHYQLTVINTQTKKMEHFFVESSQRPVLACFTPGNKAIMYTADDRRTPRVVQQPIFKTRLDALAVKLHGLMFEQLPLEIVMNIADFVDCDNRKRLHRNL